MFNEHVLRIVIGLTFRQQEIDGVKTVFEVLKELQNVQVSDTTEGASSNAAKYKITFRRA